MSHSSRLKKLVADARFRLTLVISRASFRCRVLWKLAAEKFDFFSHLLIFCYLILAKCESIEITARYHRMQDASLWKSICLILSILFSCLGSSGFKLIDVMAVTILLFCSVYSSLYLSIAVAYVSCYSLFFILHTFEHAHGWIVFALGNQISKTASCVTCQLTVYFFSVLKHRQDLKNQPATTLVRLYVLLAIDDGIEANCCWNILCSVSVMVILLQFGAMFSSFWNLATNWSPSLIFDGFKKYFYAPVAKLYFGPVCSLVPTDAIFTRANRPYFSRLPPYAVYFCAWQTFGTQQLVICNIQRTRVV